MAVDLWPFGRKALHFPIVGIAPRIIDMLDFAHRGQTIVGQADAIAAGQEQPARTILAHGVARIDMPR